MLWSGVELIQHPPRGGAEWSGTYDAPTMGAGSQPCPRALPLRPRSHRGRAQASNTSYDILVIGMQSLGTRCMIADKFEKLIVCNAVYGTRVPRTSIM